MNGESAAQSNSSKVMRIQNKPAEWCECLMSEMQVLLFRKKRRNIHMRIIHNGPREYRHWMSLELGKQADPIRPFKSHPIKRVDDCIGKKRISHLFALNAVQLLWNYVWIREWMNQSFAWYSDGLREPYAWIGLSSVGSLFGLVNWKFNQR